MYALSKWIGPLLSPLPLIFGLGIIALWAGRRTRAAPWLAVLLVVLWANSTEVAVRPWIARLESVHTRMAEPKGDAIVVPGGYSSPSLYPSGPPEFHGAVDRVVEAIHLLREGAAPRIVLSGSSSAVVQQGEPEAARVGRWLETLGVRPDQLVLETTSRNTAENARETARLAPALSLRRVVLVTSALHMSRAVRSFERAGFEVVPHPVDHIERGRPYGLWSWIPSENWLYNMRKLWREQIGSLWYRVRYPSADSP